MIARSATGGDHPVGKAAALRLIREPEDVSNRSGAKARAPADHMRCACRQPEPFLFFRFEDTIMTNTVQPPKTPATPAPVAPTIALRKSCNPDGIGLSHYVLMDKKAAK